MEIESVIRSTITKMCINLIILAWETWTSCLSVIGMTTPWANIRIVFTFITPCTAPPDIKISQSGNRLDSRGRN